MPDLTETRLTPDEETPSGAPAADLARQHYRAGANCAQSVLLALPEALGRPDLAVSPALGAGWAGGIGNEGCLCGALAAAVMIAGQCAEECTRTRRGANRLASRTAAEIKQAFEERFGSTCCRTVKRRLAPDQPDSTKYCIDVTAESAAIAAEILARICGPAKAGSGAGEPL